MPSQDPKKFHSWLPPLYVFVAINVWNLAVLLFDFTLMLTGNATITQWVHDYPWLGAPMVLTEIAGVAGLALHLWVKLPQPDEDPAPATFKTTAEALDYYGIVIEPNHSPDNNKEPQ